jgi:hypothetical protein
MEACVCCQIKQEVFYVNNETTRDNLGWERCGKKLGLRILDAADYGTELRKCVVERFRMESDDGFNRGSLI